MASYQKLCTRFYDLDKPEAPDVGLRHYLPYLAQANGPVLELMCGSGRYFEPFLAAGYDVDGIDASPDMLAACRNRIATRWPRAGIFKQDIDRLDLPRQYRLAIVTSGSFSLLTNLDVARRALSSIFNVLDPGGVFVGDIQGIDPAQPSGTILDRRAVRTPSGSEIRLTSRSIYDAPSGLESVKTTYVLVKDGMDVDVEHEELGLRYYTQEDFTRLLTEAGFIDIAFETAYPDTAVADMGCVLLFECKRPIER